MNAVKILGIIAGLGLAGVLLWSFYLKSTPLPERTFERGLPSEAKTAKNPVPMKPTDPKDKPKAQPDGGPAAGAKAGAGDATAAPKADADTPKAADAKPAAAKEVEAKKAEPAPK